VAVFTVGLPSLKISSHEVFIHCEVNIRSSSLSALNSSRKSYTPSSNIFKCLNPSLSVNTSLDGLSSKKFARGLRTIK
ncbi:uncharacterized protein METZ01_LOCUS65393, partial [marine metagenome]